MELIQNGYSCPREMRLFYDLFFSDNDDVLIIQNFIYENKNINVYTEIIFENRSYFDDYDFKFDRDNKSEKLIKKIFIASCTKSFSHAAMKIRKINFSWGVMCGIRPAKNVRELSEEGFSRDEIKDIFKSSRYGNRCSACGGQGPEPCPCQKRNRRKENDKIQISP